LTDTPATIGIEKAIMGSASSAGIFLKNISAASKTKTKISKIIWTVSIKPE
jgi:Flp pilus assembly CpaE family ATPase